MSEPFVKDQAHRERIEKGEAILPSYSVTESAEALAQILMRCRTVLGNMALENEGAIFNRWPINHEPLRSDARNLVPLIDEALAAHHTGALKRLNDYHDHHPLSQSGPVAQASANCDCGFSADVCKTNPCMRKKMATSGLNPDAKYPYCGAERAAQEKAIAWMNSAHVEAYQAGQKDGVAWASPVQSDFYTVALYAGPSVSSTLRQCPICARRVASPCETLAIATSCPLSSTNGNTP